ncbi:MAG: zinc-ribbon domain-containing protein [Muribaculaceae bacterium]|nr:zinc-ribbon domain-containing protein [Muribaculaceae bacterium]
MDADISDDDQNAFRTYRCDVCGHEYTMKIRTKAAGHGCPSCLKSRVMK